MLSGSTDRTPSKEQAPGEKAEGNIALKGCRIVAVVSLSDTADTDDS